MIGSPPDDGSSSSPGIRPGRLQSVTETKDPRVQLAQTLHRLTSEVKRNWTQLRVLARYDEFEPGIRPILTAARAAIDAVPDHSRDVAQIDAFVMSVMDALRTGIRLEAEDRARALLYSILVGRELETLSMQRPVASRVREAIDDDIRNLYGELGDDWQELDPSACWFTPGATADPDASVVIDLFKVVSLTYSEYDALHIPVLIPRSKAAKWVHSGRRAEDFDPAWMLLTLCDESVRRQKLERDDLVRDAEKNLAEFEATEQRTTETRLREFDAALPGRREELTQAVAAAGTECEQIAKAERKRAEADLVELSKRFKPAVSAARSRAERTARRTFVHLELPAILVGAVAALFLHGILGAVLALALGGAVGFGIAWWVRRTIQAAPAQVEKRFKEELKAVRARATSRADNRGDELRATATAALADLEVQRDAILTQSEQRLQQARQQHDERIDEIAASHQQELTARPLKDCEEHPAILMGLDGGFMRGKVPSKELIKVLHDQKYSSYVNSLSPDGRERLVRERDRLPRKEFDQLIERLIS